MELLAQANRNVGGFFACFPLLVGAIVLIVVLLFAQQWRSAFRDTLSRVAAHLRGTLEQGGFFADYDRVHFDHGGRSAVLWFSREGKNRRYTHVDLQWAGPRIRCEVYPEGFLASLRKLMGMHDIVIGSPLFDSAFVINGDDERGIRSLLNAQVQAAIFNLHRKFPGLHVRFGSRSLTVTCHGLISEFSNLVELVNQCRQLCDAAAGASAEGIEFVGEAAAVVVQEVSAAGHCMVCGEALASQVVYCRSCQTPHHRECWGYFGGCSTYGCGEKSFARKG